MNNEELLIRCRDLLAFHADSMGEDRDTALELIQALNEKLSALEAKYSPEIPA